MRQASLSRSFARARSARSLLTPCPPLRICGEGGRKGSPEFPLSTSWRGGQGVRTNESERACHPERRRREGPAFPQVRRTLVAACDRSAAPVFSSPSPNAHPLSPHPTPPPSPSSPPPPP